MYAWASAPDIAFMVMGLFWNRHSSGEVGCYGQRSSKIFAMFYFKYPSPTALQDVWFFWGGDIVQKKKMIFWQNRYVLCIFVLDRVHIGLLLWKQSNSARGNQIFIWKKDGITSHCKHECKQNLCRQIHVCINLFATN